MSLRPRARPAAAALLTAALVLLSCVPGPTRELPAPREGQVIRVVDGDTVIVDAGGIWERIRLIGINAPEMETDGGGPAHFARESTQYAREKLLDRQVRLEFEAANASIGHRDKHGRLLAYIYADGELFNALIVAEGYAYAFTKFPFARKEEFRRLQREAKRRGAGLWSRPG